MDRDQDIIEILSDRKRVFDGKIIHVDHMTATLPNGKTALREVALHVGASAIVPVDEEGHVFLVRQYRAPLERVTLEIPAGKLDFAGEDRLEAARRKLREETGFSAKNWRKLTDLATTPGFCSEVISIISRRN
jgi:ADP-ribose pyrophosphatase